MKQKLYHSNNQGYTLLEMLIVLSLLGMIGLVVLPLYSTTSVQQEIEHVFKQFEEDYFYVQQKAITESKVHRIVVNSLYAYYYAEEMDSNVSKRLFIRHLPEYMTIRKVTGRDNDLVFSQLGHIQKVGTISFTYQFEGKIHRRNYVFQVHTGRFRVDDAVY